MKPTIYEALKVKIGREPTHNELKADVKRILEDALVERSTAGKQGQEWPGIISGVNMPTISELKAAHNDPHDVKIEAIMRRMRQRCTVSSLHYLDDVVLRMLTSAALKGIEDVDGKPLASALHPNEAMYDRVEVALQVLLDIRDGVDTRDLARAAVDEVYAAQDALELNAGSTEQVEITLPDDKVARNAALDKAIARLNEIADMWGAARDIRRAILYRTAALEVSFLKLA